MKKHSILLFIAALLPLAAFVLLLSKFDGILATLGELLGFHSDKAYQSGGFAIIILLYICAMAATLLLPAALYHLQYEFSPLSALRFTTRRYMPLQITLPLFVMRFAGIDSWLPYLMDEEQIANPLYHPVLWAECAEWGSLAMMIVIIFWVCLLAMNLFGSMPYGYIIVNLAGALCLPIMLYLSLDYAAILRGQNVTLTLLVLVTFLLILALAIDGKKQNLPSLRPFFAQGEENERKWKEEKKHRKKWYDHK